MNIWMGIFRRHKQLWQAVLQAWQAVNLQLANGGQVNQM